MYDVLISLLLRPVMVVLNKILRGIRDMNAQYAELRSGINELIRVLQSTHDALEELRTRITDDDATPAEIAEDIANIQTALSAAAHDAPAVEPAPESEGPSPDEGG